MGHDQRWTLSDGRWANMATGEIHGYEGIFDEKGRPLYTKPPPFGDLPIGVPPQQGATLRAPAVGCGSLDEVDKPLGPGDDTTRAAEDAENPAEDAEDAEADDGHEARAGSIMELVHAQKAKQQPAMQPSVEQPQIISTSDGPPSERKDPGLNLDNTLNKVGVGWSLGCGIPLVGPSVHGVWTGHVKGGVHELSEYLKKHWAWNGEKLPLPRKDSSAIYCYTNYKNTNIEYNGVMQRQNTLRWGSTSKSRIESIRMQLPGYRELECGVWKLLELHFPQLVRGIGLHNGHILRQFRAADGGSGFDYHVDDADQADATNLYLSVAVKLTEDPPISDGTWMQVEGCEPIKYGSEAGSAVIFVSRRKHRSFRTPHNMKKLCKVVLFFKFTDSKLQAKFDNTEPHLLTQSALPPQVRHDLNHHLLHFVLGAPTENSMNLTHRTRNLPICCSSSC